MIRDEYGCVVVVVIYSAAVSAVVCIMGVDVVFIVAGIAVVAVYVCVGDGDWAGDYKSVITVTE